MKPTDAAFVNITIPAPGAAKREGSRACDGSFVFSTWLGENQLADLIKLALFCSNSLGAVTI